MADTTTEAVEMIEQSTKRQHFTDVRYVTVRWEPYKPDGARQMKAKGRWQEQVGSGDYFRWQNCDRPEFAHDPETIESLTAERDAANARADAAERENEAYRAMHLATVAERAENGGNPVTAQMRLRKAEEAARDAALVEAADIILADNYDDPDDAADAILALRDKPAPAVTVEEAAMVLLDLLKTPSEKAPIEASHIEDVWTATFRKSGFAAVKGFLRAIAGGGDE